MKKGTGTEHMSGKAPGEYQARKGRTFFFKQSFVDECWDTFRHLVDEEKKDTPDMTMTMKMELWIRAYIQAKLKRKASEAEVKDEKASI